MAENICAGLRENTAEKETKYVRLELSNGCHVYLKSSWETTNLSIVVLDGVHAWSRTVSAKEVVSIATSWKIDVGEFMKSARSHLCRQHPTSSYSISAEKDADIVQLSFTIDDLLEGDEGKETLQFDLRLTRLSEVGAVVCDMLDHVFETKDKLKEQLAESEHQLQKTLAASEPEPSITLSFARPSANPRRQSSSFVEPRVLDFTKSTTRSVCTPKVSSRLPSFDLPQEHGAKQTEMEVERDSPLSFFQSESRMGVRSNDLTVRAREAYVGFDIPLSPSIMRVLNNLGAKQRHCHGGLQGHREEGEVATGGVCEERGVKVTEMRSPARREEQPQRSFMVGTNPVSIDLFEEEGSRRTTTMLRQKSTVPEGQPRLNADMGAGFTRPGKYNNGLEEDIAFQQNDTVNRSAFTEKKKLSENHNGNDVNGGVLEKGSSNAGESVRGLNKFTEGEAKEGSDEEPTSKVTVEDAHLSRSNSDPGLRVKAGFAEKCQHEQKLADQEEAHGAGRHEFRVETRRHSAEKRSLECLWSKDIVDTTTTKSDKRSPVTDAPDYARQRRSCSNAPVVERRGRKRTVEDREDDFSGRTLRSVKLEAEDSEGIYGSRGGAGERSARAKVKREVVDLDDHSEEIQDGGKYKKSETFQDSDAPPGFTRNTIADLLREIPVAGGEGRGRCSGRGRGRGRGRTPHSARASPREKRQRSEGLRDDRSPLEEGHVLDPEEINVDNFDVPDPDYYNFDKERTEELILPNQIWAVYDEKDGFPRVWAAIDKVSRHPKFEVSITWLTPHKPSVEAVNWFKTSGYPISCGKFERGDKHVLSSINTFSHKMEFEWVARNVVTIYPKKGEVWALYTSKMIKSASENQDSGAKYSRFRVVHLLEDVELEKRPFFSVLERVKGFRTVYQPDYRPGAVAFSYLVLFSHRVPAYQLQGNEGPLTANLKGFWDVDPAGLPLVHEPVNTFNLSTRSSE